jgi:hypothetical protein
MNTNTLTQQLTIVRGLGDEHRMLAALRVLVATTLGIEALKALTGLLRAARDKAAPDGYAMHPVESPWFLALREAYGEAMTALGDRREAAGLHRFETNCGACEECLAFSGRLLRGPGGEQ